MEAFNETLNLARELLDEADLYAGKPTKAASARLRKLINELGKQKVQAKKDLMAADKA